MKYFFKGYTQRGQHSMDWTVNRGPFRYTGPEVDHTFGTKGQKNIKYVIKLFGYLNKQIRKTI